MTSKQKSNFDFEKCFNDNHIPLFYSGSNVGKGWVGMNCPFCGNDTGGHLGVNKTTKIFTCWKCKTKGHIEKLLTKLFPNKNSDDLFRKYGKGGIVQSTTQEKKQTGGF
ncbi:MAG: hypothetical protein KAH38_05950, partial [Candidatus Hydrogenedentes bacterium]|nr:hypothetical protein [Candidatus Hydrogenedentota bacterium]